MTRPAKKRRIAILTGGGDCPGLNAVIRAVVKTAENDFGWEVYGVRDGFEGFLVPSDRGISRLDRTAIAGILPLGGTILGASNRCNLFAVERRGRVTDESHRVPEAMARLGLSALILVGGVVYSLGALVYAKKRPDPAPAVFGYHEVFHALVITAAVLHFAAVSRVVLAA